MEVIAMLFLLIFLLVTLGFCLLMLLGLVGFSVVAYVLESKSMYAIAKRRGIERPWLAWIPGVKMWILGAISDQYRYLVHGQQRSRRKLLLWLGIVTTVAGSIVLTLTGIWSVIMIIVGITQEMEAFLAIYLVGYWLLWLMIWGLSAISTVSSVFSYFAYYDLFRSCEPKKSLVYLLVSIFATYPLPFFLYRCKDKDLGMPPRNEEPKGE